ncbi:MAG: oxygenase MpaB family protein [Nitriliruptoraceae bacterium]
MFGPPPFDPEGTPGDIGLVGPASASWRLIAEPAAIAGGIRGLLLQVAHPMALAGVTDHSRYEADPLGRLQRTSQYVTTSVYGSTAEAIAVARRVRAMHTRVRGVAPDGRAYRADDPELLTWVSLALTSSFLAADHYFSPYPLVSRDRDRFVAEQSTLAALLDPRVDLEAIERDRDAIAALRSQALPLPMLVDGLLPGSVVELTSALTRYAPDLGLDDRGRALFAFLRRPPLPLVARLPYRTLLRGAIASLSDTHRRALEITQLRDPDGARAAARRLLGRIRVISGTSPAERLAARRNGQPRTQRSPSLP